MNDQGLQLESVSGRGTRWRFVVTIFVGSFLLFLIQPMIARMALPRLGGAPAVWNSAMLVYQGLLLAGYAFAHWLGRFTPRRQAWIQASVLALAAALLLPIRLTDAVPPPDANAYLWVPWLLVVSIGPLFLFLSAQAPLVQRWYAASKAGDPYPLYSASNVGSFCGLLAYPLAAEPLLSVTQQSRWWSLGYVLLIGLVLLAAWRLPAAAEADRITAQSEPRPGWRRIAGWILLAAVPSGLMLSTTLYLTTDIVAMPLLWAIPLGLYLLSFTIAFATDRLPATAIGWTAPALLVAAALMTFIAKSGVVMWVAGLLLAALFAISVAIHARLFDDRPRPQQLTLYYLALSAGGMLGGIFCALVAPLLFDWTYEHPLLLLAAAWLLGSMKPWERLAPAWSSLLARRDTTQRGLILVLLALVILLVAIRQWPEMRAEGSFVLGLAALAVLGNRVLFTALVGSVMLSAGLLGKLSDSIEPGRMTRSYFGVYSVGDNPDGVRVIIHGTTVHGAQLRGSPELERTPTSYYLGGSGVGLAMQAAPALFGPNARIDVIGLGSGTLACYARPGQRWRFYEIDPVVVDIARNPQQFSFLSRCLPGAEVILGDARLSLERQQPGATDLLVVDAFSSDSIPMHLLTREAFDGYRRHLTPNGLLVVHLSNRYLGLEPVVKRAAERGWTARLVLFEPHDRDNGNYGFSSIWVVMSSSPETIAKLEASAPDTDWRRLRSGEGAPEWTDDYASIIPILKL
jgi:hypothetical protein